LYSTNAIKLKCEATSEGALPVTSLIGSQRPSMKKEASHFANKKHSPKKHKGLRETFDKKEAHLKMHALKKTSDEKRGTSKNT
jgi:hypothetical protein